MSTLQGEEEQRCAYSVGCRGRGGSRAVSTVKGLGEEKE